ncbi:hypothetical protein MRX96_000558 [Rhipicephalus microplus]
MLLREARLLRWTKRLRHIPGPPSTVPDGFFSVVGDVMFIGAGTRLPLGVSGVACDVCHHQEGSPRPTLRYGTVLLGDAAHRRHSLHGRIRSHGTGVCEVRRCSTSASGHAVHSGQPALSP